ncbi:MAG TPA: GNAT family N-acetyltransferase, partial [Herpetosiphonaceae bacterium]|nr:GNAT family N-acetyltransferase [Herpetosiphonaceae bacterium]
MTYLTSSLEATEGYVLRSVDIDKDAEKLAQMWSASDDQWPGSWSRGVPITAQRLRDWLKREKRIDALVWDTGDAIAGYCSLWEWLDEPNVTYIALLNVAPRYQKQSLARKFLTHYVERAIKLGSVRLDLHTWSGNLKAVPLYKKCGFFWLPGTSVHMLNFLPTILTMPCTQSFFAKHDWYRSLRRTLTQNEDDECWEGMKVFTYRFEEDGDALTVWVDRESRTVAAVDTDDFFAAAIADELEPPRGLPATVRWKLANKRDRPLQVSLIASGTEHLKLDQRATLELAPGETITLSASVRIAAEAPDVERNKPAPFVKSLLIVDGDVIELGTGLRPEAAVEVSTEPEYVTLLPGVPQTIELQLRSHLKRDVEAIMSVAPAQGLAAEWTQQTVSLPAKGYSGHSLKLSAEAGGVFDLPVSISIDLDGEQVHQPARPLVVFALPIGGVLGAQVEGKLRVENDTVRLLMGRQGAELTIRDRATNEWLAFQEGRAAPPVRPSEYSGAFDLSLEPFADHVVAVAAMASRENPGFVLRKRITVGAGPIFTIDYDFENLGAEQRRFQLSQMVGGDSEKATLTLPLAAGLGRGTWEEFPGPADDESRKAEAYAERWAALENGQMTVGLVWASDVEEIESTWALNLLTHLYECPPQSRVRPGSLQVYVGDGGWRTVHGLWRRLAGQMDTGPGTLAEPSSPLRARIEPPV